MTYGRLTSSRAQTQCLPIATSKVKHLYHRFRSLSCEMSRHVLIRTYVIRIGVFLLHNAILRDKRYIYTNTLEIDKCRFQLYAPFHTSKTHARRIVVCMSCCLCFHGILESKQNRSLCRQTHHLCHTIRAVRRDAQKMKYRRWNLYASSRILLPLPSLVPLPLFL